MGIFAPKYTSYPFVVDLHRLWLPPKNRTLFMHTPQYNRNFAVELTGCISIITATYALIKSKCKSTVVFSVASSYEVYIVSLVLDPHVILL